MCLTLSELERTSRALNLNVHMLLMTAFGVALGELHTIPDPVSASLGSHVFMVAYDVQGFRCRSVRSCYIGE